MSQFIYSIYDLKGSCHDRIFCCAHDSDAVRLFDQLVFSQNSPYRDYGEDFVLSLIASFDPSSGHILPLPVKQLTTVMERQVYFEALQRIREAKVESAVRDQKEPPKVSKVESAAGDQKMTPKVSKVESAAGDQKMTSDFSNFVDTRDLSSSDDFEPLGCFLGDF